jgi:hypothetical protein
MCFSMRFQIWIHTHYDSQLINSHASFSAVSEYFVNCESIIGELFLLSLKKMSEQWTNSEWVVSE